MKRTMNLAGNRIPSFRDELCLSRIGDLSYRFHYDLRRKHDTLEDHGVLVYKQEASSAHEG